MLIKAPLTGLVLMIVTVAGVTAQTVDQTRGRDQAVDYASLARFGPWDDRNYALTAADLVLLAPNEHEQREAIPAFFRVELRRQNPGMRRTGPAQYPRSALPRFFIRYGGYRLDGRFYLGARRENGRFVVDRERLVRTAESPDRSLATDVRVTSPVGAAESAVAIHPTNPDLVIAGSNGPASGQKMHYSGDGAATWSESAALPLGGTCCDPTVAWSSDGSKAYAATLSALSAPGIWFYRSGDNGQTWSDLGADPRRELGSAGFDKEYLHVDTHPGSPHLDNIYLTWHENNVMKFARSSNFGNTWTTPISVSIGTDQEGIGSDITTDLTGSVYYFWPAFNSPTRILVAKSTDGGGSFAAPVQVATTQGSFIFPIPSMETREVFIYVAAAADLSTGPHSGSLYAAWTDSTGPRSETPASNHARIQLAYSRDAGASWTVVTPHETVDSLTVDRWHPWLAIGADGTVHLVFYDTRNDPTRTSVDLFYTRSTDGGQTFISPRQLSSVQSPNISNAFEFGDYNGLDVFLNDAIGVFTDNRDESVGGAESVDIYAAGVVACTAQATILFASQTLGDVQAEDHSACDTLTADPDVTIAVGFPVRFRAKNRVILGNGFSVATGADFAVEANPALIAE